MLIVITLNKTGANHPSDNLIGKGFCLQSFEGTYIYISNDNNKRILPIRKVFDTKE